MGFVFPFSPLSSGAGAGTEAGTEQSPDFSINPKPGIQALNSSRCSVIPTIPIPEEPTWEFKAPQPHPARSTPGAGKSAWKRDFPPQGVTCHSPSWTAPARNGPVATTRTRIWAHNISLGKQLLEIPGSQHRAWRAPHLHKGRGWRSHSHSVPGKDFFPSSTRLGKSGLKSQKSLNSFISSLILRVQLCPPFSQHPPEAMKPKWECWWWTLTLSQITITVTK